MAFLATLVLAAPLAASADLPSPRIFVSSLRAVARSEGGARVEWTAEPAWFVTTFTVERSRQAEGPYVALGEGPIPAMEPGPGGLFSVVDPAAQAGDSLFIRLTTADSRGAETVHGPYALTVEPVPKTHLLFSLVCIFLAHRALRWFWLSHVAIHYRE